ncbi:uncharacterized protein V1516DRAFT_682726 [Lipomyces oligophaga]|uniref:uncharacterized protein n=1 Tax=Lipomyces oligophaga TaxID=45792 RepID=UPI0034CF0134
MLDVLIVGGGPAGLAIAARLLERTPDALFSDLEQQRFHWLHKKRINTLNHRNKTFEHPKLEIHCIDATSGSWMGQWDRQFEACQIPFLRSPMFFHPDPQDINGMIAFAYKNGRQKQLMKITGVAGKELSKHQMKKRRNKHRPIEVDHRDDKDYFRPSTKLFHDYCQDIVQRYDLEDKISHQKCSKIDYDETDKVFTVETCCGDVIQARYVVLACGPIGEINQDINSPNFPTGCCHTSDLFKALNQSVVSFPPSQVQHNSQYVVVGGGLTGAQLCHRLLSQKGVTKVHWILRSRVKVKHFDFDLEWVSKYKNYMKSTFWMLDTDEERWHMIKQARDGGSVNPEYYHHVKSYEKKGVLEIHEHSTFEPGQWSTQQQQWTDSKVYMGSSAVKILHELKYVYYATGSTPNINGVEFLQPLLKSYPIETIGSGLPCLTDDLEWSKDVPLYITGRLAFLRLGPAGANLEGARVGAERIASSIQERIQQDRKLQVAATTYLELPQRGENQYSILEV